MSGINARALVIGAAALALLPSAIAVAAPKVGYAIVIRDALRQQSKRLDDFIAHKETLGMKVTVVGDAELDSVGEGTSSSAAEDSRRIRSWLQQNYKVLELKYVLLIGNPDPRRRGVPMMLTHAMADELVPSDHYYADLTGDWDLDGDGLVAEYPDDRGEGGVDFAPEVYVGRIPVYDNNAIALDQILVKTIAYATSPASSRSWRRRVLQPAAMLFFDNQYGEEHLRLDGADIAAAIDDQVISARSGVTHTTLYEEQGLDPSRLVADSPLSRDNLIQTWNNGYGVVNMIGHGSADGIFRLIWDQDNGNAIPDHDEISTPAFLTYDDAAQLDDKRPSFVFHASCSNAEPERPDNLAYGLLRQGAVGTVSSTRVVRVLLTTGAASSANIFGLSRSFVRGMLDGRTAGESLFDAKLEIGDELGKLSWFTRLEIGLYGDPSLALTSCTADASCDDGNVCNGRETCSGGQCKPGPAVECVSDDPCREPICDPDDGSCELVERPDGERCDDGRFCTVDESCQAGVCSGAPRCAAPNNPCVLGACDELSQRCDVYVPLDDGRICHASTDREGTCHQGVCQPASSGCTVTTPALLPRAWLLPALLLGLLALIAGYRSRTRR